MTRRCFRGAWVSIAALLLAMASQSRGDEPKTWRWVGEDGHVYTSTTPPPNGRGVIDAPPAAVKAKPQAAPPAAKSAARTADPETPPRTLRELLSNNAASAAAAKPGPADGDASLCARYQSWVDQWRSATRSVAAAEASLDRLQSDTDDYVRRNDSYYEGQVMSAEDRVTRAQDQLSQIEGDAGRAGVPQSCFTE